MTLYGVALLLVVLGALMASFDGLLLAATPFLLNRLSRLTPARRATATLVWRYVPTGLSFLLVLGVFLPAWWRYEPLNTGETVSLELAALAFLAALPLFHGLHRAARMYVRTRDRLLIWRRRGRNASMDGAPFEVVEVKSEDLALCVGGYLKPTIYASARVISSLEPEEFSAALLHEVSHASARDPLRLLWMGSCPDFLQLLGLDGAWRVAFSRASEFAADAGARRGSPEVALDLASALLKVARLGVLQSPSGEAAEGMMDVAVSSAVTSRVDIEARVEALANSVEDSAEPAFRVRPWMLMAVAVIVCGAGAFASEQLHEAIEGVGRLLTF